MKMKVLFVVTYFDCGGINRALQNLLNRIDVSKYDVDVFGLVPDGMFAHLYINCRVLPRHILLSALMARYSQQRGLMKLLSLIMKSCDRMSKGRIGRKIKLRAAQSLVRREHYDTVVAFSEGAPTYFVSLMKHPNSVAWIHCDYKSYQELNSGVNESPIYRLFKHIVCVANYPLSSFISCYPDLSSRTTAIYNIQDVDMMRSLAKEPINEGFDTNDFVIVSVGRLDPVKRLSVVPEIAKRLSMDGCDFKWLVIGPQGGTSAEYDILMNGLSDPLVKDKVLYLGEKRNPYAYIARASLLVNTSISEACPYVINEAKILHIPVVCTNFGSAKEFIINGENGLICPIEDMAETINGYIKDTTLQNYIKNNIRSFNYDNRSLMQQIYDVLDN